MEGTSAAPPRMAESFNFWRVIEQGSDNSTTQMAWQTASGTTALKLRSKSFRARDLNGDKSNQADNLPNGLSRVTSSPQASSTSGSLLAEEAKRTARRTSLPKAHLQAETHRRSKSICERASSSLKSSSVHIDQGEGHRAMRSALDWSGGGGGGGGGEGVVVESSKGPATAEETTAEETPKGTSGGGEVEGGEGEGASEQGEASREAQLAEMKQAYEIRLAEEAKRRQQAEEALQAGPRPTLPPSTPQIQ